MSGVWIRTQNKLGIMSVDEIWIEVGGRFEGCSIVVIDKHRGGLITIGTYESLDEASEVLDNIHRFIEYSEYCEYEPDTIRSLQLELGLPISKAQVRHTPIFQLPEKGFTSNKQQEENYANK